MKVNPSVEWLKHYTKLYSHFQHVSQMIHWLCMVIFFSIFSWKSCRKVNDNKLGVRKIQANRFYDPDFAQADK